jgi:hypothetical protein
MSTTSDNETSATGKPQHFPVPDGKSELPVVLPDFPPPGTTDPIPPKASQNKTK